MKIYLKNGVMIDFKCEKYDITKSSSTGEVTGYNFENSNKSIAFLNKTEIIAITGEKV
jgi:hypothetical protein